MRLALDLALLAGALGLMWIVPDQLAFLTRVLIMILLVLSLDLVVGFAGIATLGQAAMFGSGAYAAALFALHVSAEPLSGLVVGMAAAAGVAFVSGLALLRAKALTLLVLTIAVAEVLQEVANQADTVTGGADGLGGYLMAPLLGAEFDLWGRTGYLYALGVLALCFAFARRLAGSPLGLALRGIREAPDRMHALGTPVYWRLVTVYTLAGGLAGAAGALSAQTTELVSPAAFDFSLSAEALIMLILGGTGRLYGAILGTVLFMAVHHFAAAVDPFNWLFAIGALVLAVVFLAPAGLVSLADRWVRR
ncbi:MAG TPA: branched-chain amino acid ABC transporter permease [Thermohalobaculum sp.]|nr:branched-chain amino acid ABC transporter permease [Thermohalobaculum sp.]